MGRLIDVFVRFSVSLVGVFVLNISVAIADWVDIDPQSRGFAKSSEPVNAKASKARYLLGDIDSIRAKLLSDAPYIDLTIPLPEGEMATYRLAAYDFAAPDFQRRYPELRAFKGFDVSDSSNTGHFSITPTGFRAMFKHDGKRVFVDPEYRSDTTQYMAYYRHHAISLSARFGDQYVGNELESPQAKSTEQFKAESSDGMLRTYRIAFATTGQYGSFPLFGGTVLGVNAELVNVLNRLNEIYGRELNINFQLAANNDSIIFTDANTDPFTNTRGDLNSITSVINNSEVGSSGYDIGHLLSTSRGSVARTGVVCGSSKGAGLTGFSNPVGDVFYVDLLAHEIGHQFSALHTFNGTTMNCGGARTSDSAFEPGSGSTIMAYASICGAENLQASSDDYFHAHSIEQITNFVKNGNSFGGGGASCGVRVASANRAPVATAAADFTIPANTAFKLAGSANDADGDALTYTWEQFDAGNNTGDATTAATLAVDNGTRPLFRSLPPSNSPSRTLPRLSVVVNGNTTIGGYPVAEAYPTKTRELNFRFTVRDANGGTAFDETVVNVENTGAAFAVTSPSAGDVWQSSVLGVVQWNVAGTNRAPINCPQVDILLSTDGGASFSTVLASAVSNDGSADVAVPAIDNSRARVMVRCSNDTFFAVSSTDFQLVVTTLTVSSVVSQSEEEGQALVFPVTLSAAPFIAESLSFVFRDATTTGADFGAVSFSDGVTFSRNVLTIPTGVSSFTVTIPTVDDTIFESDETLSLSLAGVNATGTIINNDDAPPASSGGGGSVGFAESIALSFMLALMMFAQYRKSATLRVRTKG